jgi:hypothetical protein
MRDDESEVMSLVSMCATEMSVEEQQQGADACVGSVEAGLGEGTRGREDARRDVGSVGRGVAAYIEAGAAGAGSSGLSRVMSSSSSTKAAALEVGLELAPAHVFDSNEEGGVGLSLLQGEGVQEGPRMTAGLMLPDEGAVGNKGEKLAEEGGGGAMFDMGSLRNALMAAALAPLPDED